MIKLEQPIFGKIAEIAMTVKTFLYGVFLFLDINTDIVKILAILMAIDTVLGIFKSVRLNVKVSFKKLIWGMITKVSVLHSVRAGLSSLINKLFNTINPEDKN